MFNKPVNEGTVSDLNISTHELSDNLQEAANDAGRKVRALYNSASGEMSHASDAVTSEIRSHPIRFGAIALGVGVLLGILLRR